MLKAVKTFSASSSSLSPPYRCSSASMSEREEFVLVERSIRRRAVGGLSSGNAEWEDVRRTVGGGPKPVPCRGEGVAIDAEFDVSGESTVGSRGADSQRSAPRDTRREAHPLILASLTCLAFHPRPLT